MESNETTFTTPIPITIGLQTQPTCEFRWRKHYEATSNITCYHNGYTTYITLEQKWINSDGTEEWKEVPFVGK